MRRELARSASGISALAVAAALSVGAALPVRAQSNDVKIGFVTTFSGPAAAVGNDLRDGFELALDHLGRKMGGLNVNVIYEDDGLKPEQGLQKTEKLVQSDRVNFLTGYMMSHILLASMKPAFDSQTFLISANAGPSQIAGEQCSPWFFSSSWQGDQVPQAVGDLERAIAAHVADDIRDGATLQFGIGAIPAAIISLLGDRRGLGLHGGMLGDPCIDLVESGAATGERKSIDAGLHVGGEVLGTRRLFDWVHRNERVMTVPARYSHGPANLARIDHFVAVNSTVEIALDGSVEIGRAHV